MPQTLDALPASAAHSARENWLHGWSARLLSRNWTKLHLASDITADRLHIAFVAVDPEGIHWLWMHSLSKQGPRTGLAFTRRTLRLVTMYGTHIAVTLVLYISEALCDLLLTGPQ